MILDIDHIIGGCKNGDPVAQKKLYEASKDVMYGICVRYVKDVQEAEDVLIEGYFKVFNKISGYKSEGSFEGWMKRIMINESLMHLRKKANFHMTVELQDFQIGAEDEDNSDQDYPYTFEELMAIIDQLPVGYRTIFNLYVLEDYKHREIAEILGISINTSKSQLILAKKKIIELLSKKKSKNTFILNIK